jgi:3-oxoacyl-[acyl-carrier protein] reductase
MSDKFMAKRTCAITGAGSGIGREVAKAFAGGGYQKLFLLGKTESKLQETAKMIEGAEKSATCHVVVTELTDHNSRLMAAASIAETLQEHNEALDALVNNAGYFAHAELADLSSDFLEKSLATNLTAPIMLTKDLLPQLLKSRHGSSVTNISSTLATKPIPGTSAYNASKAGLEQATKTLALELGPKGVRFNTVAPGVIDTPMFRDRFKDPVSLQAGFDQILSIQPLKKIGTPGDVAQAVLFLADAPWVTGAFLAVDGGMLCT